MECYLCNKPASAKIGESRGNIWKALINRGNCWDKREIYLCRNCYDRYEEQEKDKK